MTFPLKNVGGVLICAGGIIISDTAYRSSIDDKLIRIGIIAIGVLIANLGAMIAVYSAFGI